MTDYTDLIARLRAPVPTVYDCKDAADALAAQAEPKARLSRRILWTIRYGEPPAPLIWERRND